MWISPLVYSPIQLRMVNQYHIFPICHLENVGFDLGGIKVSMDFELIEIMGGIDPYPSVLGIEWDCKNYGVTDLKNRIMTFEVNGMRVTQLLYPHQGS